MWVTEFHVSINIWINEPLIMLFHCMYWYIIMGAWVAFHFSLSTIEFFRHYIVIVVNPRVKLPPHLRRFLRNPTLISNEFTKLISSSRWMIGLPVITSSQRFHKASIHGSSFLFYVVKSSNCIWQCTWKRATDFLWLQSALLVVFVGYIICQVNLLMKRIGPTKVTPWCNTTSCLVDYPTRRENG